MITIALMGSFTDQQLEYTLNSIFAQTDLELELIIAVNGRDTSLDTAISILNAHDSKHLKRIIIHPKDQEVLEERHLEYIRSSMKGDSLLLLRDGACFYDSESLRKCVEEYGYEHFMMGTSVVYGNNGEYLGDIRASGYDSVKDFLHQTLANKGGILLPYAFASAEQFQELPSLNELEEAVWQYLSGTEECRVCISEAPILKCYRSEYHLQKENEKLIELRDFYNRNSSLRKQKEIKWKLNCSDHKRLVEIIEDFLLHANQKERNLRMIDELVYDFSEKEKRSAWGITDSNWTLLYYLLQIRDLLLKKLFVKYHLKKFLREGVFFTNNKIRVVFIVVEIYLWISCYKSVYDKMVARKDLYEVDIVYVPFAHPSVKLDTDLEFEKWMRNGLPVLHFMNYNLAESSPDIVFLCKPYEMETGKWRVKEIKSVCPNIIYIPYNMALIGMNDSKKRLMFRLPLQYYAWKSLAWNTKYVTLYEENAFHSQNKLEIGHPKFDVSQEMLPEKERKKIAKIKEIAGGRKILFWNTSFVLEQNTVNGGIFLEYGMHFLQYVQERDDIFLLWRPHPMFFQVLEKYDCYEQVMRKIKTFSNRKMYLDTGSSQWIAVFASDFLVSDLSGIIESYILTEKPIVITTKGNVNLETDGVFYQSVDFQSLAAVLSELLTNHDLLALKRKQYLSDNYFFHETRSVADKLLDVIEDELGNRER